MTTRSRKFNIIVPQGANGIQGLQGIQGFTGADGTSVTIKGQVNIEADLQNVTSSEIGDGYIVASTGEL